MAICTDCALIVAMKKATSISKLPQDEKQIVVGNFVDGHITFKEAAKILGLSSTDMESILNPLFWDEKLKGD